MEPILLNEKNTSKFEPLEAETLESTERPFIQANTIECTLNDIKYGHVIPVFAKDNEPLISHADFIESFLDITRATFPSETILSPKVRVSHPIKGRIPEAKDKVANELLEHEKTIYFERMAFIIEIPTISDIVGGHKLSLTLGGVKSFHLDNLYSRKGSDEHFKVFIGFKNSVCTNLCVSTDGFLGNLAVRNVSQLKAGIRQVLGGYNANYHLHTLGRFCDYSLTESQFAHLIGRCRLFNFLPNSQKVDIKALQLSDTQLGTVAKDFYRDESFCRDESGNINLWRLYNLFTGANKGSYIDTFLDRSVNAFQFVHELKVALDSKKESWYLN